MPLPRGRTSGASANAARYGREPLPSPFCRLGQPGRADRHEMTWILAKLGGPTGPSGPFGTFARTGARRVLREVRTGCPRNSAGNKALLANAPRYQPPKNHRGGSALRRNRGRHVLGSGIGMEIPLAETGPAFRPPRSSGPGRAQHALQPPRNPARTSCEGRPEGHGRDDLRKPRGRAKSSEPWRLVLQPQRHLSGLRRFSTV